LKKALIVYWSAKGNTEKVAFALRDGLRESGVDVTMLKTTGIEELDYFDYDLVCVGFPIYHFHPPDIMDKFLKSRFNNYQKEKRILPCSPIVQGKNALIFCTYSGPHSGIDEVTPAVKYAGQFFVHVGISVIDEWYVVGEFHGREDLSTKGKLGDIRGKPTEEDLNKVKDDALQLARNICSYKNAS
jgi:flavodoxin